MTRDGGRRFAAAGRWVTEGGRRVTAGGVAGVAGAVSLAVTLAHPLTGRASVNALAMVAEVSVLLVLTVVTVRRSPARQAAVAATLSGSAVAFILLRAVWQGPPQLAFGACAAWALGAVAATGVGLYLRRLDDNRRRAVEEATRAQRLGLARDLHDFVAHDVNGMLVQAQAARVVAGELPEPVADALRRIEEAGQRALASLDRTVHALGERGPGIEGLARLADAFSPGVRVDLHVEPGPAPRQEVSSLAYRVVAEALTNVRRHAPRATIVAVEIGEKGGVLRVRVADDGGGSSPSTRAGGFGLAGLGDLLEARGGRLTAGPHGPGWQVVAEIPA
ncbi:sensor histidine kinase [Nonomuraea rubra]|uniref:histidine kinase n=1 Tax=Nonomuraea rubra TaxID=46180 RepID=A0A7X0NU80_9ACTN|nr:histidine kinase [Nonomuraea rubra]MBB6549516.1 signal transduction histidine kinase [Nonomuraea rubra]